MSDISEAIDEARLAYAEASVDFMPDTCTITTPAVTVTNAGDGTWAEVAVTLAGVPCKYTPLSAYERAEASRIAGFADHRLTFPAHWEGAALEVPSRATVTVAARGLNPARTFTVTGPHYSSSRLSLRVTAKLEG